MKRNSPAVRARAAGWNQQPARHLQPSLNKAKLPAPAPVTVETVLRTRVVPGSMVGAGVSSGVGLSGPGCHGTSASVLPGARRRGCYGFGGSRLFAPVSSGPSATSANATWNRGCIFPASGRTLSAGSVPQATRSSAPSAAISTSSSAGSSRVRCSVLMNGRPSGRRTVKPKRHCRPKPREEVFHETIRAAASVQRLAPVLPSMSGPWAKVRSPGRHLLGALSVLSSPLFTALSLLVLGAGGGADSHHVISTEGVGKSFSHPTPSPLFCAHLNPSLCRGAHHRKLGSHQLQSWGSASPVRLALIRFTSPPW